MPREVVDVLVEAGSEIDVPLNLAACFNKADMVGWLLDAGADPAATHIWGITPLQSSAYHGGREAADVLAEALALAAHLGRDAACERLLDRGAEIARAPLYGITALHFAASMGRRSTVALLVARGAPLDCRDGLHGGTPLDWALHNAAPDDELVALLGGTAS